MKTIILISIFSILITSCSNINKNDFFEKYNSDEIQSAVNDFEKENKSNILYELKPIKVYRDRVNICFVTKVEKNVEYGFYFVPYISSHLPKDDKEWKFTFHKNGKIEYIKYL